MFTITLNAANTVVSAIGCVTADTVTGGAASAIGAAFSLKDLVLKWVGETPFHKRILDDLNNERGRQALTDEQVILFDQMLAASKVDTAEVIACGRIAPAIVNAMLRRLTDSTHKTFAAEDAFRRIVTPVLETHLKNPDLSNQFRPAFEDAVVRGLAEITAQVSILAGQFADMGRRLGLQEGMIVQLARVYAPGESRDFETAHRNIEAALKAADEMNRAAQLPRNTDDAVQAVLGRVAGLNKDGHFDAAQSELDDALDRLNAQRATLLDNAITQARLRNDPATAARRMVDRLRADNPPDLFDALRTLRDHHYVIGRDRGIGFDLALSIDLARHCYRIAPTPLDRAAALNDLANALQTQGNRTAGEVGTALLAEAVAAHREALVVANRADLPLQWATTLQNLAAALETQGTRTAGAAGKALLAQAVAANQDALSVLTREDQPERWATTVQSLASALRNQGARTAGSAGTALLTEAVAVCHNALAARDRTDHPLEWAITAQHLATALQAWSTRTADTEPLAEAISIFREVLTVITAADHPVRWMTTTQNLASALANQGSRTAGETGTALLAQAVAAYRDALSVLTPSENGVDWAKAMQNLANTPATQGSRAAGAAGIQLMSQAVIAYREALTVRTHADQPVDWAMTKENMAICETSWAEHPACTDPLPHLRAALTHVDAALTVFDPVHMPFDHSTATALRAKILAALGPAA